jgi:hypothetical protein
MRMLRRTGVLVLMLAFGMGGVETGASLISTGTLGSGSAAEARVGRPATPVSVAGATRRTVRRCAADVYDC